jgi:DNA-binding response OmpR family regulator
MMIQVYHSAMRIHNGEKAIRLRPDEYRIVSALAMVNNGPISTDILLDAMCAGRVQIGADRNLLHVKLCYLRKKIGRNFVKGRKGIGYVLTEPVQFVV